jgi:hypothetical protein
MINRRGYVLTLDALLALMVLFISLIMLLTLGYLGNGGGSLGGIGFSQKPTFEKLHVLGENAMNVLNKNGVLEEIISKWAQNDMENATKIANYYLDTLALIPKEKPRIGYRLEINGGNISERTQGVSEEDAVVKTRILRIFSIYGENETIDVMVARAWLLFNDTNRNKTYSLESVPYGNSFKIALGGNWTIDHLGMPGTSKICVPEDCSGDDEHNYTTLDHFPPDNNEDALDDSIYRLLEKLDLDNNGRIDIEFNEENMTFKTSSVLTKQIGEKSTEVKLILWI